MTSNTQQAPYLREQRNFPAESIQAFSLEVDRAYVDIAQKVNARTIAIYANSNIVVTGERWYLEGETSGKQTQRILLQISSAGSFPHNLDLATSLGVTKITGTFTDGTNWYPLPYVSTTVTAQVSLFVTQTDVNITAGSTSPTITSGFVIIEFLSS